MTMVTQEVIERVISAARERTGWEVAPEGFQPIPPDRAIRITVAGIFIEAFVQTSENADFLANAGRVIVTLAEENERLKAQTRWRSVKEKLPPASHGVWSANVLVLRSDPDSGLPYDRYHHLDEAWQFGSRENPVTHWQPMPDPLEEEL